MISKTISQKKIGTRKMPILQCNSITNYNFEATILVVSANLVE